MKKLYKIQSISDVVTNSSSELFIMRQGEAEHIKDLVSSNGGWADTFEAIDMDYIKKHALDNDLWEMVCDLIGKDYTEAGAKEEKDDYFNYTWWDNPDEVCWEIFVDENKGLIQEKIINQNYWAIEFDDHFTDASEVNEKARDMCVMERNHH